MGVEHDPLMCVRSSATSRAAAESVEGVRVSAEKRLLAWLQERGELGATDHEIADAFGWPGDTVRPRRRALVMAGFAKDSGKKRRTGKPLPSGERRRATVWVTSEPVDEGRLF